MQSGQPQIKIDTANLIKAGTIPIIAAAVAGLIWILGFNIITSIIAFVAIVIFAFAGYWYVNLILKSGAKPTIVDVAINGAILGAVISLVYGIAAGIGFSIATGGFYSALGSAPGSGGLIVTVFEGAVLGALGAGGWFAYKSGMIKTS